MCSSECRVYVMEGAELETFKVYRNRATGMRHRGVHPVRGQLLLRFRHHYLPTSMEKSPS